MDGTLIEDWASHKSFKRKDDDSETPPERNTEVDFKGQGRCNDTHESATDADARLFKKSPGDNSRLCHKGHILMENRNGLIVDVEITYDSGKAEREAALAMLKRRGNRNKRPTVWADRGYDSKAFIKGGRKLLITLHVAAKDKQSAVDGCIKRHEGYKTSLKVRERIEEAFGWIKTVGGLAKTKLIGQAKLTGQMCSQTRAGDLPAYRVRFARAMGQSPGQSVGNRASRSCHMVVQDLPGQLRCPTSVLNPAIGDRQIAGHFRLGEVGYPRVERWASGVRERPTIKRGGRINRAWRHAVYLVPERP